MAVAVARVMSFSVSLSMAFSFSYSLKMSADVSGVSPDSDSTDAARRGVCDGVMIMLGGAAG